MLVGTSSAKQSSTYLNRRDLAADKAIDGRLSTFAATNFTPNQWWKVILREQTILDIAWIYVRQDSQCESSSSPKECCEYGYKFCKLCETQLEILIQFVQ